MLKNIYPRDWENKLEGTNMRVDEENGGAMGRRRIRKVWRFLSNEYWKNIGFLILDPTFGI